MKEAPAARVSESPVSTFDQMCQKVQRLYPGIKEIQFFEDPDKHTSFWIITPQNVLDVSVFDSVQQRILAEFSKYHKGLKCSIHNIHQVSMRDIVSQGHVGKRYIAEIVSQVVSKFPHDTIRILYKNGQFMVYGAAPRDHNAVYAEIMRHIPSTLPCLVQFQSEASWEEDNNLATTIDRANAAFAGVDISTPSSSFYGIALLVSQLKRVIGSRIFPE